MLYKEALIRLPVLNADEGFAYSNQLISKSANFLKQSFEDTRHQRLNPQLSGRLRQLITEIIYSK